MTRLRQSLLGFSCKFLLNPCYVRYNFGYSHCNLQRKRLDIVSGGTPSDCRVAFIEHWVVPIIDQARTTYAAVRRFWLMYLGYNESLDRNLVPTKGLIKPSTIRYFNCISTQLHVCNVSLLFCRLRDGKRYSRSNKCNGARSYQMTVYLSCRLNTRLRATDVTYTWHEEARGNKQNSKALFKG